MHLYRTLRKQLAPYRAAVNKYIIATRARLSPKNHILHMVRINDTNFSHASTLCKDFQEYQVHADTVYGQIEDNYEMKLLQVALSPSMRSGKYHRGEVFTCVIPNARIYIGLGAIVTPKGELVVESLMSPERANAARYMRLPRKVVYHSGTCTTIWHAQGPNYSHWLSECLPRLYSLSQLDETITLLMPNDMPKNWMESLKQCLPRNVIVEYHSPNSWFTADRVILASPTTYTSNALVPQQHGRYIRDRLYSAYGLSPEANPHQNIYITRRNARKRFVLNEDEVIAYLSRYGFTVCSLDTMTYREQVAVFHDARNIVAPHGAGNTNVILSDYSPRVSLLEFINLRPKPHFLYMCKGFEQHYYYIFAGGNDINSNLVVNMEALKQHIEYLL